MIGCRSLLLAVSLLAACAGDIPIVPLDVPPVACGNGVIEGSEVCDDGNTDDGDDCSADCSIGISENRPCGNGTLDGDETCDDGNQIGGDGCSADCASDERCGNGVVDTAKGETCDDGNTTGGDGCSANCQSNEGCGNFNVDNGEACDAGPNGSSTCDVNCTAATCGDGTLNTFRGEQCDAGPNGDAACDTDCTPAFCGDLKVNTIRGETCDDGNAVNTDACISCTAAACGDGIVRTGVEQCDDGNVAAGDGCSPTCTIEQQPKVYVLNNLSCNTVKNQFGDFVCSSTQLLGFTRDCGNRTNPYICGQATGFTWVDSTPFQPSRVRIEVSVGINASLGQPPMSIDQTAVTSLNGTATGNFLLPATSGQNQCVPTTTINTWELTNVSSYRRNQQNTLNIAAINCFGLGFNAALNGFVRITVFP